jgi:hypothetical protein
MDNVQNCDSYINMPSSQTYRSHLLRINEKIVSQFGVYYHMTWYRVKLFI